MTPQKIADVATYYFELLREHGVEPCRIDPERSFATQSTVQILSHAAYLCAGIPTYVFDDGKIGKANRHLASAQMCLSFVGWFTLNQLRTHNVA